MYYKGKKKLQKNFFDCEKTKKIVLKANKYINMYSFFVKKKKNYCFFLHIYIKMYKLFVDLCFLIIIS